MFNRLFKLERFLFLIIPRHSLHTPFPRIVLLDMNKEGISVLIRQECLCYNETN